jgi:hypothetical protein
VRTTEKTLLSSKILDPAVQTLLVGLLTEGEQHKQYYLEKALRALVVDDYADRAKERFQWEPGIAP